MHSNLLDLYSLHSFLSLAFDFSELGNEILDAGSMHFHPDESQQTWCGWFVRWHPLLEVFRSGPAHSSHTCWLQKASGSWLGLISHYRRNRVPLVAQWGRIHLLMQETWVLSMGWEGPLEEGMATHCGALVWKTLWTEEPGGLRSPRGCKAMDTMQQ